MQNDSREQTGLRLVSDLKGEVACREFKRQFVNFHFLRFSSDWRKVQAREKEICRAEFSEVFESFREHFLLHAYCLVGFDSKADLMFRRIGDSLDLIQEMTTRLHRTRLGSYLETVDTYLSATRGMMFVTGASGEDRFYVCPGEYKYLFLYPCVKNEDLTDKSADERDSLVEENFMVGKHFQNVKIHMTHAFGFNDQEYIISFEADEPKDFLALAEEFRQMQAGKFSLRPSQVYACRRRELSECLGALG